MSIKKVIIILLVVALVGGYVANKFLNKPPKHFFTVMPKRGDIVETVIATGKLVGLTEVNVGAQVTGQVQKLYVKLGDKVKKGDMIAEIDPRTQLYDIKDAKAQLKIAQANLAKQKALLNQQTAEYNRQVKMRKSNATSDADLETALANLETTKASILSCEAEIEKAKVSVDKAQTNLDYTKITAPQDGVVIGVVTEEGQTVVSNQTAPTIVKLADLDTMTVEAEISEADVVKIKEGMPTYFTILGLPDRKFNSTLRQIEPATASESKETSNNSSSSSSSEAIYYNALLDVPNPDGILRVSMTAEVTIILGESKNVITIPISVLNNKVGENKYKVNILKDKDTLEERIITIGRRDNINYEVIDGIAENDRIVLGRDAESAEENALENASKRRGPPPHM
ncbi:MAG: macrolide transporter subunit MacA [Succinivibrionaceae bacterium]|nr:macrolide transporter subunit MacA [Ruminobacter sp.]MDY5779670.1 macrolide transporter subunit MacA [Succinivibrionaceae bacterium]MEE1340926.1 macrolide transporter subunit MacA [Succinivibrionaceae bacterium]